MVIFFKLYIFIIINYVNTIIVILRGIERDIPFCFICIVNVFFV